MPERTKMVLDLVAKLRKLFARQALMMSSSWISG
jgi:hypothetical protein